MIDYKIKQKEYKKAINVILEIAERKKDQVLRLIGSMARRLIEKNYRR